MWKMEGKELLLSVVLCLGITLGGALDRQEIQFSKVMPYNRTYECNENALFSEGHFGKIPKLEGILGYNVTSVQQYNLSGSWALYTEENYEGDLVLSLDVNCLMKTDENTAGFKSMQFMGNADADSVGLSLFPGNGRFSSPHGKEWFTELREFSLSQAMCVAYWASTGTTSWTVFSTTDFNGPSICLLPRTNSKYGRGELDYVYIGSGYEGCNATSSQPKGLLTCEFSSPEPATDTSTSDANLTRPLLLVLILNTLFLSFLTHSSALTTRTAGAG